jgi:hypothetical protein
MYRPRSLCRTSGGWSTASHFGDLGLIPGQSMWALWWAKWQWGRLFSEFFGFPLSVSLHQCSVPIRWSVTDAMLYNLSNWQHRYVTHINRPKNRGSINHKALSYHFNHHSLHCLSFCLHSLFVLLNLNYFFLGGGGGKGNTRQYVT